MIKFFWMKLNGCYIRLELFCRVSDDFGLFNKLVIGCKAVQR